MADLILDVPPASPGHLLMAPINDRGERWLRHYARPDAIWWQDGVVVGISEMNRILNIVDEEGLTVGAAPARYSLDGGRKCAG